jgi:hypothetical protein
MRALPRAALMSLPTTEEATQGRMMGRETLASMLGPGMLMTSSARSANPELTCLMNCDMTGVTRLSSCALWGITHLDGTANGKMQNITVYNPAYYTCEGVYLTYIFETAGNITVYDYIGGKSDALAQKWACAICILTVMREPFV